MLTLVELCNNLNTCASLLLQGTSQTALHLAACHGHVDIVNMLLTAGACIDAKDKVRAVRQLQNVEAEQGMA